DPDVVERFFLVPDVIARRHDVDAEVEQLLADLARDPESARGVLGVGDDQVDLVVVDHRGDPRADAVATRLADDVADEEQSHCRVPASTGIRIALPRRSAIFGTVICSSPFTSRPRALDRSHARPSRTTRANRPYPRSTR